jgi:hypothetical protein
MFYNVLLKCVVIVIVLTSNVVDDGFELWSHQTRDYKIGIIVLHLTHVRSKTGWIGIRIMCPSGETYLLRLYCFIVHEVANYWKITVVKLFGICITLHVLNFFQPFHSNIYKIITKIITKSKTGWIGIRIMCPSGETYLLRLYCFIVT